MIQLITKLCYKKLNVVSFEEIFKTCCRSFLSRRIQFVDFQSVKSNEVPRSDWGVSQGSVLDPLLFLIYLNHTPQVIDNNEVVLFWFADYTTIIGGEISSSLAFSSDFVSAQIRFDSNKLTINVDKCCTVNLRGTLQEIGLLLFSMKNLPRWRILTII